MKILRLTTLLDFGGQEKQYDSFTEKPMLLQNEYVFAAIGFGGRTSEVLTKRGFKTVIFNRNYSIRNFRNLWVLYQFIKKEKPDIVHTAVAEANLYGILAAKLAGVKYIIGEEAGIPNHSNVARKVFSLVYKLANKVVCVSQSVKDYLIETGEITAQKGIVVYNPVSISLGSLGRVSNPTKVKHNIVYVGRLEKVKNVETLIKAFAKLENKNTQLTIIGDGRERGTLENLVTELQLTNRVAFKGFQSEPAIFLCKADLYVLPSYSEGFGIAAVEAMFLKVPVLCSNVGGIPEFVKEGETGWLFNPNKVDELTEKLDAINNLSEQERNVVATNGYHEVINRFTVENYINAIEKLYERKN